MYVLYTYTYIHHQTRGIRYIERMAYSSRVPQRRRGSPSGSPPSNRPNGQTPGESNPETVSSVSYRLGTWINSTVLLAKELQFGWFLYVFIYPTVDSSEL